MGEVGLKNNRAISEQFITDYDTTAGDAVFDDTDNLTTFTHLGVQLIWSDMAGTLDGEVILQQTINGTNWDDMGVTAVIDSSAGSCTLGDISWTGAKMRAKFTANGITSGMLNGHFMAKD